MQSGAVRMRAHEVHGEYRSHAHRLDREHSPAGTTPIYDRFVALGDTRGLAFGAYGEASGDAHHLISHAADVAARDVWQAYGARCESEVRGFLMQRLRRRVGVLLVRENARHRLRRLPVIGVPRVVLERRQQHGRLGGRHGLRQPGRLGGLGIDDFYRYQAPIHAQAARA